MPPRSSITRTDRVAVRGASITRDSDAIATEEPLEIRVEGPSRSPVSVAVTMRTPGHDDELAVGFLRTEALIASRDDLAPPDPAALVLLDAPENILTVRLSRAFDAGSLKRNFYATSSCGICGKASIDQIHQKAPSIAEGPVVKSRVLLDLPQRLRDAQIAFEHTGGLHASGLFSAEGELLLLREDVGRHNALDKVIGRALLDGALPLSDRILMVSGRASFELVQKAAMAACPIVCAVSAPSSLAVEAAERLGVTLVGFLRGDSFNVYAHPERIDLAGVEPATN